MGTVGETTHSAALLKPPTRALFVWLYSWEWWIVGAVVVGAGETVLVARAAKREISRSEGERWGRTVAWAGGRLALTAGAVALLVICLANGWGRGISKFRWGVCYKDLLNINLALQMYMADNDDYPPAGEEWCDLMMPYIPNHPEVMVCPEAPGVRSGYALNGELAGRRMYFGEELNGVVTLLESDRGWNSAGGPELLPEYPRHWDGDNYGYLDGSCGWNARKVVGRDARGRNIYAKEPVKSDLRWTTSREDEAKPEGGDGAVAK